MPFTCAICALDISVGEPMLSDERMNLAHESCIRKGIGLEKETVHLPSATVSPPPPPPPPPSPPISTRIPPSHIQGVGEFLTPTPPKICIECSLPCIAMCPICMKYVHQCYGYSGHNCSGRHESRCPESRELREPLKSPLALKFSRPFYDTAQVISKSAKYRKGMPKKTQKKKKKARR